MLLRITVLQYLGAPPQTSLAYIFDERGGSIGREDCSLTLPDETRVLSRVQAQIVFADGLFSLIDRGGNPSVVNSLRVGKGNSRVLYDGDIIELCDYKLRVKAIGTAATHTNAASIDSPTADLSPPILLDPDELIGELKSTTSTPIPAAAEPTIPTEALEMTFDMDFEDLDAVNETRAAPSDVDFNATLGIDAPIIMSSSIHELHGDAAHGEMLPADELMPPMGAEHAAILSALCLGLGIPAPESVSGLLPQHLGIVMRRAMQGALAGVLSSFTPEDLEKRMADRALLDAPPPLDRKSKLWELFEQRHHEISHAAEDQFHSLFGSEFLKACEAQIKRLHEHN